MVMEERFACEATVRSLHIPGMVARLMISHCSHADGCVIRAVYRLEVQFLYKGGKLTCTLLSNPQRGPHGAMTAP